MSLDDVHKKLDKIDDRLGSIDVRLAEYNAELEFHISRHNLLEDEVLPLIKAHEQWRGAGKLLAWISVVATIVAGIAWIWNK